MPSNSSTMFMAERFVQGVIEDAARHLIKGRCIRGNGLLQKVVNHSSLPHVLLDYAGYWVSCGKLDHMIGPACKMVFTSSAYAEASIMVEITVLFSPGARRRFVMVKFLSVWMWVGFNTEQSMLSILA